jgi:hypothetical protein
MTLNKYTVVFPKHLEGGFTDLVRIMEESIHCSVVQTVREVPTDSRPIMIGAHELAQRNEWGDLRDDAIIYETEQHSWWLTPQYLEWLKKYTVWSLFKDTVPNSIYVPTGYSPLFDVPYKTYESNKWIDVLHYGFSSPHRDDVLRSLCVSGFNVVSTNKTYHANLYRLIDSAKCVVAINFGGQGDGQRFTVLRCFIPMCRGVATVAERTPDMWKAGWAPTVADEVNFTQVVGSVVNRYKEFGERDRDTIMQRPYSNIIREALEKSG